MAGTIVLIAHWISVFDTLFLKFRAMVYVKICLNKIEMRYLTRNLFSSVWSIFIPFCVLVFIPFSISLKASLFVSEPSIYSLVMLLAAVLASPENQVNTTWCQLPSFSKPAPESTVLEVPPTLTLPLITPEPLFHNNIIWLLVPSSSLIWNINPLR